MRSRHLPAPQGLSLKLYHIVSLVVLLSLLVAACAPAATPIPTATTQPVKPGETPPPSNPTPTKPQAADATRPREGGTIIRDALIESISILILESFPVQIRVVAQGNLPDGCTKIDQVGQQRQGNTFRVTITTSRPAEAVCTQALVPFEETISLGVRGLKAGTYTVIVNGVSDTFTLTVDNEIPATPTAGTNSGSIAGRLWHDLCAPGREGEPAPATPPTGCVKAGDGTVQANGILETGEPGINGVLVTLGAGACPASTVATALTDAAGFYKFDALNPGTYCVSVNSLDPTNLPSLLPGGWTYPTSASASEVASVTLTLADGEAKGEVNFGWDYQFLPLPPPQEGSSSEPATGDQTLAGLKAVWEGYQNPGEGLERVVAVAREAVSAFLTSAPQPLTQATADTLVARLRETLPTYHLPDYYPAAAVADVDGDARPDLLIAFRYMYGFPALAFLGGESYRSVPLPNNYDQGGKRDFHVPASMPDSIQAQDVTGDGKPEILITYFLPGASGFTYRVYTLRWLTERKAFDTVFQATLVTWASASIWQMHPGPGSSQEFVLTGPAFGVFDHKLLPHPTRTQVWQWAPAVGRFVKVGETVSRPTTLRQQVNVAEALLREGEYEKAADEYRKVINDKSLTEEEAGEQQPNWRAFARLRLGQVYALLGNEAEARSHLTDAQTAGSTVGQLATAFLEAYKDSDSIVAAWGTMMNRSNLHQMFYEEKAGNLGFPMTAFGVYYPGLAVAAYLDRHPEATAAASTEALANLKAPGFNVKSVLIADVNGDDMKEVVFVTPDKDVEHAWLAYQKAGRWRISTLAEADELALEGSVPLPQGGAVVTVRFPATHSPGLLGYSWNEEGRVEYDLEGGTPIKRVRDPWPTLGVN
ncbi:MAG: hypothetical protein IT330_01790 [Anaerolineae bacterium]|nr:hypothetical protein [Anaerolineae bacterium]